MRSVKVQRTKIIAKIDEHIQALLDAHAQAVANYEKRSATFDADLAKYKQDAAAYYERIANAMKGTSKDKVSIDTTTARTSYSAPEFSLSTSTGKPIPRPHPPTKPQPVRKVEDTYPTAQTLQELRAQKALLEATDDEVITVGASDYGTLFTSAPGSLRW